MSLDSARFTAENCPRVEFVMARPAYEALCAKVRSALSGCVHCGHALGVINGQLKHSQFLAAYGAQMI